MAARIDDLVTRLGQVVRILVGLTVLAGLLLLAGLALVSARSRRQEAALYRVLGADRRTLAVLVAGEFLLLSLIAAAAGVGVATLLAWWGLPWLWTVPVALPAGALLAAVGGIALTGAAIGLAACLGVLRSAPAEVLGER
jgi:putative ABC transport system permease protein